MAALANGADVLHAGTVTTHDGFQIDIWNIRLSGDATDTFTVPGVLTTNGIGILLKGLGEDPEIPVDLTDGRTAAQASITAAVGVRNEGVSTVTVTNSATPKRRNRVIIATLRQRVGVNSGAIDEDPT